MWMDWVRKGILPYIDGVYNICKYPARVTVRKVSDYYHVVILRQYFTPVAREYKVPVASSSAARLRALAVSLGYDRVLDTVVFSRLGVARQGERVRCWRYPRGVHIDGYIWAREQGDRS